MGTNSRTTANMKLLERAAKMVGMSALSMSEEDEDNPGDELLLNRVHSCCPTILRGNGDLILADKNPLINAAIVEALEAEQRDNPTKLVGFMTGFSGVTKGSFMGKLRANMQLGGAAAFMTPTAIFPKGQSLQKGAKVIDAGTLLVIKELGKNTPERHKRDKKISGKVLDITIGILEKKNIRESSPEIGRELQMARTCRQLLEDDQGTVQNMARSSEEEAKMILAHEYCHAMIAKDWLPEFVEGMSSLEWQTRAAAMLKKKKEFVTDTYGSILRLIPEVTLYGTTDIEEKLCDMYALARYRPEMIDDMHQRALAVIFGKPITVA